MEFDIKFTQAISELFEKEGNRNVLERAAYIYSQETHNIFKETDQSLPEFPIS